MEFRLLSSVDNINTILTSFDTSILDMTSNIDSLNIGIVGDFFEEIEKIGSKITDTYNEAVTTTKEAVGQIKENIKNGYSIVLSTLIFRILIVLMFIPMGLLTSFFMFIFPIMRKYKKNKKEKQKKSKMRQT